MSIQQKVRTGFLSIIGFLSVLLLGCGVLVARLMNVIRISQARPDTGMNLLVWALGAVFILALVYCGYQLWRVECSLRDASIRLGDAEAQLASRASDLRATAGQQASGATEQAAAVSQITATVEELSRTAHEIAHTAEEGLGAAEDGQGAVRETVEGMDRIKARVGDVANRILSLGEKSQRIGEINEIITDVAGKTHLLALNAAIESAAAGEFGARFAVVAAQVKELADETREATGQVRMVIQEIQNAINASVMATEETTKEVRQGAALAARSGKVIEEIVERVQGISLATQQQQSASEQVVVTMRDIQEVARQSAVQSQETVENAGRLVEIAQRLGEVIAQLSHEAPKRKK